MNNAALKAIREIATQPQAVSIARTANGQFQVWKNGKLQGECASLAAAQELTSLLG